MILKFDPNHHLGDIFPRFYGKNLKHIKRFIRNMMQIFNIVVMSSRSHSGLKMKKKVQLKIALTKSNIKNSNDNKMSVFKLYKITSIAVSPSICSKYL